MLAHMRKDNHLVTTGVKSRRFRLLQTNHTTTVRIMSRTNDITIVMIPWIAANVHQK